MKLILLTTLLFVTACSTSHKEKSELKEIETKLDRKQDVNGETLGVKGDSIVIQRKRLLSEEYRILENETYSLEYEVYGNRKFGTKGLYGVYRDCKIEENSSDLGGSGKMPPIEKKAPVIPAQDLTSWGVDENDDLVSVEEEYISKRIERFQKYKAILIQRRDEYELKVKICETNVQSKKNAQKK